MDPRRLVTASIVIAASLGSAAARAQGTPPVPKKPLTHEALWLTRRVGSPAVSPDGRSVVFSVTEAAYDEKKEIADLWLVPADGSAAPRRLTSSKGGESGPKWSPDSRRVAFTAKREDDEVAQVYVIDVAGGGEAQRVTASLLAARGPVWSPDGASIAYQAAVYRGAADAAANAKAIAERRDAKSKVRVYESFPLRRWDKWLDETQTHLFVTPATPNGTARDLLAGTALVGLPGFGGPVGEGASENVDPAWAPDGRSIVFGATTNRDVSAYDSTTTQLFEVPVAGGEPHALTSGTTSHEGPVFAPDGRTLCFRASQGHGVIYALDGLACAPWPWRGSPTTIASGFDRSVAEVAFAPDSRTLFLTAEDAGYVRLYAVPTTGGTVKPVTTGSRGVLSSVTLPTAARTAFAIALWGSAVSPNEVVRVDTATGAVKPITSFNALALTGIDLPPLQEFWFTNGKGRRVHNFVALPAGFDPAKKYPLLVLMHGGFANMWRDSITYRWNYHLLAAPGYVVLMTDYRGSTGYGLEFTLDIQGDPLRGPAEDVNQGADEAIKRYPFIDATRQAAAGASYGGHLANWLEATTTRYRCLVSHAGLSSLETQWGTSDDIHHRELMMGGPFWENTTAWLDQSPVAHARDFKTPMLLSVGENDFRVPMNNTLEMFAVLQRMRVPARLLVWPDENHWIQKGDNSRVFYGEVHGWLARWLK
jgi:dipeptidyl aminopeptidase/acylaminoacyl peptidase